MRTESENQIYPTPWVAGLCMLFVFLITGCTQHQLYQPVTSFESSSNNDLSFTGTDIEQDLTWARNSQSLSEAVTRWEKFLQIWDVEVEDGYAQLRIDAAKMELMRVYYLLGHQEKGDALYQELDPLQIE